MRHRGSLGRGVAVAGAALILAACGHRSDPPAPAGSAAIATSSAAPAAPSRARPPVFTGGALVRAADEDALYLADEDHDVVRRITLPLNVNAPATDVKTPGPPAQVIALAGRILVTVRGVRDGDAIKPPGLMLIYKTDRDKGLVESARVELPADAWGLALTPDEKIALVSSAWTHQVSAVDLDAAKKLWSLDVAREPRGIAVRPDGKGAYIAHLTRASLTRIDDLTGAPRARDVAFPAAPIRTPPADAAARSEAAKLAYAPVLSPDGARLFVARQALGATGKRAWNGQATVDILLTADDTELAEGPARSFRMLSEDFQHGIFAAVTDTKDATVTGPGPTQADPPFVGARAVVYRKSKHTLLVASEGTDALVELDALSIDPSVRPLCTYLVGGEREIIDDTHGSSLQPEIDKQFNDAYHRGPPGQTRCGAPSGVAISADESTAYVFCRSTDDLATVALDPLVAPPKKESPPKKEPPIPTVSLGKDALPDQAALGRRLFYDARDRVVSGGYACASCHPEGRDDGHVWHEDEFEAQDQKGKIDTSALHAFAMQTGDELTRGAPRQTPMLAGRVAAPGPYGWKGRSPNLRHRVVTGFTLHRWAPDGFYTFGDATVVRAEALAAFVRTGLVPPPREARDLTAEEQRGRAVFNDAAVGCATCHVPSSKEYTNRAVVGLGVWPVAKAAFEEEKEHWRFKTPSLLYVAGTPPYFHDGSAATLEDLVDRNGTRMGHTQQLSKEDRTALVAFLKTL